MPNPPTSRALLSLYSSLLRTSGSFSSYNFRNYFIRKTKASFRAIQNERDPSKLTEFYNQNVKELSVLKRSAIVNQLYGGWKLAVEKQRPVRDRGDT